MDWDMAAFFGFVIALVAVRGHYRNQRPSGTGLSPGDQTALSAAMETARRLEQRVETLERLLDEDAPGWRARTRS